MDFLKKLPWKKIITALAVALGLFEGGHSLYMAPSPKYQSIPQTAAAVAQHVADAVN